MSKIKYFLVFVVGFLLIRNDLNAQSYLWQIRETKNDTTYIIETTSNYYFPNFEGEVNFDSLVSKVRNHREPDYILKDLKNDLDSIKKLPTTKALQREIALRQFEIESKFQIINFSSFGVALYDFDTIEVDNKRYTIYLFSTNFKSEWNEDHINWFFYYNPYFGVLKTKLSCLWEYDELPCYWNITQVDLSKNPILEELKSICGNGAFKK